MTGWVVQRDARTAYLSSSVPSTGVSPLMPPHSQGAERRRGHRAGRTGARWALRALVIGGLAGAALLLSGAAAQAADRDPAGEGLSLAPSLIGSVVHGDDHRAPVVDRVLKAAVKPLESDRHHGLGSAVALRGTLDKATHAMSDADSALGGVDGVVRELTAPLRPAGVAVDTRHLAPVTDLLDDATATAKPVRHCAQRVTGSDTSEQDTPEADADRSVAEHVSDGVIEGENIPAAERELDRQETVGTTAARQPAAVTASAPETVSDTPGGDGPAPLRVHLGAANGLPASGSGTATDGGSAAVLPAKVADSTVACHRLPIATDVEVRRHDAEAPTVSPD